MQRISTIINNLIFFLLVLLVVLLALEERVALPLWLQVAGRLHPMILHLPIGLIVFSAVLLFLQKHFKKKAYRQILFISFLFSSLTASLAALAGFFLSLSGDYGEDALQLHKISGVSLAIVCYLQWLWFSYGSSDRRIFYAVALFTFLLVLAAGHTGSVLTHGENYILSPLTSATVSVKNPETTPVYELSVQPVLEKKCFACHNASKAKGLLVMTSMEQFQRGGKQGKAWVEGQPELSRMIQYIHLPLEDDLHMPPDGKPQLTTFEIRLLEAWIRSGADFNRRLSDYAAEDSLVYLTHQFISRPETNASLNTYSFSFVSAAQLEKLNTAFRTVTPIHQGSPALQAEFFVREFYEPKSLEELIPVKEQLVKLSLAGMPVTDDDLKTIAEFRNLEKLNLNFTNVQGNGLVHLKSLSKLNSLSLAGTRVQANQVESLLSLPALKEIYLWNTAVSDSEIKTFTNKYPDITFTGSLFEDDKKLKLSKPQLIQEGVIRKGDLLTLKHGMPGVTIRYSINEAGADSLAGTIYNQPVKLNETVKLKAIACKQGWYCSDPVEAVVFVEGHAPLAAELLSPPDKKYPGEGGRTLINLQKGYTDYFREPNWLGYRDNAFEAGFDFGTAPPAISKLVISYGDNLGAWIFPPVEVEVWAGPSQQELKRLVIEKYPVPTGYRQAMVNALSIEFPLSQHAYYKVVAKPVSRLPEWHGGKGQKGWFFVDEVFFY